MQAMYSTRHAFGEALLGLAREGYDVVAVTADTYKSMCVDFLRKEFPERCFDTGIAEQTMMMVAAGLAASGKIAFASTYSVFTSMRCCEQIRTFIAYPGLNVKIAAGLGGLSAGIEGVTHIAIEDLGIMRCIPNMVVLNPADAVAARAAVKAAADTAGPVYIRLGRDASPVIFGEDYKLTIGKANELRSIGKDAAILVTGNLVFEALQAADVLKAEGIKTWLVEFPTIKPIDTEAIERAASETGALVTVEEHTIIGGLGSAVAETLADTKPVPLERVGVRDVFVESATPDELRAEYGLKPHDIVSAVKRVIRRRDE